LPRKEVTWWSRSACWFVFLLRESPLLNASQVLVTYSRIVGISLGNVIASSGCWTESRKILSCSKRLPHPVTLTTLRLRTRAPVPGTTHSKTAFFVRLS